MTDHIEAARKVANEGLCAAWLKGPAVQGCEVHIIVAALAAAGLLRTGDEKEVMLRLTTTVQALLPSKNPAGLLGQRIGIAPDFPDRDPVTDLHERALKACEDMESTNGPGKPYTPYDAACTRAQVIGRESLAAKQPKPRWTVKASAHNYEHRVYDSHQGEGWVASFSGENSEADARAYAAQRNREERVEP